MRWKITFLFTIDLRVVLPILLTVSTIFMTLLVVHHRKMKDLPETKSIAIKQEVKDPYACYQRVWTMLPQAMTGKRWDVYFSQHTNRSGNSYVVIRIIKIRDGWDGPQTAYYLERWHTPEDYIKKIHTRDLDYYRIDSVSDSVDGVVNQCDSTLKDDEFRGVFRTAEAIVSAYFYYNREEYEETDDKGIVPISEVFDARARMEKKI